MEQTGIAWCDGTWNGWEGCSAISAGCLHCYAEARNARFAGGTAINWGPGASRRRTSPDNWKLPLTWNRTPFWACAACGWRGLETRWSKAGECPACPECGGTTRSAARMRVFCSSLSDVFDNEVDPSWRADLLALVESTPGLDWLFVTKRVGNVERMVPDGWFEKNRHVWLGITVCDQVEADREIAKLAKIPAAVRFLSMEPLLGPVTIAKWLDPWCCSHCGYHGSEADSGACRCDECDVDTVYDAQAGSDRCPSCQQTDCNSASIGMTCPQCHLADGWGRDAGYRFDAEKPAQLDWIIVGGESGPDARPMAPTWARSLRDQCSQARVPFLFKQWGTYAPGDGGNGADGTLLKVGKERAGRLLDGAVHHAFPACAR